MRTNVEYDNLIILGGVVLMCGYNSGVPHCVSAAARTVLFKVSFLPEGCTTLIDELDPTDSGDYV